MKRSLLIAGILALVVAARAFPEDLEFDADEFNEELVRNKDIAENKTLGEIATEFVRLARSLVDPSEYFHVERTKREAGEGEAFESLVSAWTRSLERQGHADEQPQQQQFAAAPEQQQQQQLAALDATKSAAPSASYAAPAPAYEPPKPSYEAPKPSSYEHKKKKCAVVIAPAPILVPIPGPPGLPGPPGIPGLPGLPGKTPSLRGLKAILLGKVAKLWLLAKAVAVLCFLKFGGNLALILGLVLPLYAKLKKAGVVLPVHESYDAPAPSYGAPAPAPYEPQVHAAVEYGKSAYEAPAPAPVDSYAAPPPPAPHRRRRFTRR